MTITDFYRNITYFQARFIVFFFLRRLLKRAQLMCWMFNKVVSIFWKKILTMTARRLRQQPLYVLCPMFQFTLFVVRFFHGLRFFFRFCVSVSNDKRTKIKAVINSYCFHFGSLSRCKKCSLISSGFFFFCSCHLHN